MTPSRSQPMSIAAVIHELRVSGDPTEEKWADEIESLRAQLASARKALEIARNMIRDKWIESAVIETQSMRSLGETLDAALKEIS